MQTIKSILNRNKSRLITALAAFLILLGSMNLYLTLRVLPMSNDECLWVTKTGIQGSSVIEIQQVKVNGVTWNAGIRNGDILVKLNGIRVSDGHAAMSILNQVKAGEYADYVVRRGEKEFNTTVYIKKLIDFGSLGFDLLALIWLFVGLVVLTAKPEGFIQRLFFAIGGLSVTALSLKVLNLNFPNNPIAQNILYLAMLDFICILAAYYLPFAIVYFFFSFPKPFKFISKPYVKKLFIYAPLILFTLTYIYKLFVVFIPRDFWKYGYITSYSLKLISLGFFIGIVALYLNYRRIESKEERRPVLVILLAYALAIAAILYNMTLARVIADSLFNSPEYFTPIILIAILPVSFGYSIFKYQLMDVSIVVKNAIIYGTATAAIAVIYLLTMYGLGQSVGTAIGTEYRSAIAAVAFVMFALVFQSTKQKFQDLLTRKFYPEQFTYQQVILKFSSDVVAIVGQDNILNSMKETFVNALKIKKFAIVLKEENSSVFSMKKSFGLKESILELDDSDGRISHYIRGRLLSSASLVIDRQEFEHVFGDDCEKLTAEEIFTAVPMVIKGKLIGFLLFGLKYSGSQFGGRDIELLCAAASQAAVAIENARLYEAEAQKITIERDLTLAKKIQQGLLPGCVPDLHGLDICGIMHPAMLVGGDYYDYIQVSPDKLFVVVGDVSGKGLSASLYMTKLQTMMRLYCTDGRTPREILIEVNKRIYEGTEKNWFITASLALFDISEKTIKFCRAGHLPLAAYEDGGMNLYTPKGMGLGLDDGKIFNSSLEEITITYDPDNIYSFFSDGITEAMNSKNELFGIERLVEDICTNSSRTAAEITDAVLNSIGKFRDGREQNDDITLVTVKSYS